MRLKIALLFTLALGQETRALWENVIMYEGFAIPPADQYFKFMKENDASQENCKDGVELKILEDHANAVTNYYNLWIHQPKNP